MQQEQGGRIARTGIPIEDRGAVDVDGEITCGVLHEHLRIDDQRGQSCSNCAQRRKVPRPQSNR